MQKRAAHNGRRTAWFALVILLAVGALGLFAAGVGLLGTDPDECSATAGGRRLEEVHATEPAEPTRAAATDRTPRPPAAEVSAVKARAAVAVAEAEAAEATSSRRRRLCAAADCTEVAYMGALFEAMRVDIINTGDAKVVDLIAAFRTSAWSKCSLGRTPARFLCLLRARLAVPASSALPGRGPATGRPATASGARAPSLSPPLTIQAPSYPLAAIIAHARRPGPRPRH